MPEFFQAVGQYYEDFSQTTDEDVRELLGRACAGRILRKSNETKHA